LYLEDLFNLSYYIFSASPATVDFLVRLDKEFEAVIIDELSTHSRDVLVTKKHPSTMPPAEAKRVRNEILHLVYGKKFIIDMCLLDC
jgi:hypothetical protein